ncbi:ATP-binding protein [Candidatus Parcubacteria bacterium]|nr:ATP-binding protein [Candidatus Parcubacteria bacterium]
MKFYNRKNELKKLQEINQLAKKRAQMTVITGRRRVGKTELISQFLKKKDNCFYFFVEKKRTRTLLEEFTGILRQKFSFLSAPFTDWSEFWHFIFEISKKEQLIIVFDEFQNFKYIDPANFSIIQKYWDQNYKISKLNLIFIGSIISLMEKIFIGSKEPLFGRASHKIYLEPFNFLVVKDILKDHKKQYTFDDLLNFYTVFGGIPKYYAELENQNQFSRKDFSVIIKDMFLEDNAAFKFEGYDLLSDEFGKNYQTYFSILQVIASGSSKMSEVANRVGIPATALSRYLDDLLNKFRYIKRKSSLFSKKPKNNRYYLNDYFLTFWFRYMFQYRTQIEIKKINQLNNFIKKDLNNLKGLVFEDIARDWILHKDSKGEFIFPIDNIGSFWDKKNHEIDLVAYNEQEKKILFLECKLSPNRIDGRLVKELKEKAEFVKWMKSARKAYFGVCAAGKIKIKTKKALQKSGVIVYDNM